MFGPDCNFIYENWTTLIANTCLILYLRVLHNECSISLLSGSHKLCFSFLVYTLPNVLTLKTLHQQNDHHLSLRSTKIFPVEDSEFATQFLHMLTFPVKEKLNHMQLQAAI